MITEKTARNRENAVAQAIKPEVEKINRGLQYLECLLQNHNEALQNYQQRVANRDAIEREIHIRDQRDQMETEAEIRRYQQQSEEEQKRTAKHVSQLTASMMTCCEQCGALITPVQLVCHQCGAISELFPYQDGDNEMLREYTAADLRLLREQLKNVETINAPYANAQSYVDAMQRIGVIAQTYMRLSRTVHRKEQFSCIQKEAQGFIDRCHTQCIEVAVVGDVKAGKSTLINALLGARMASTDVTPETATLVKYRTTASKHYVKVCFYTTAQWDALWASTKPNFRDLFQKEHADEIRDKYLNREPEYWEFDSSKELGNAIMHWTSKGSREHYFVSEINVGYHGNLFPSDVVLVDTPGLKDPVDYRSNITKEYIRNAHWILACIPGNESAMSHVSTYDFLNMVKTHLQHDTNRMIIVATHADTIREKKRAPLQAHFLDQMHSYFSMHRGAVNNQFIYTSPLVHLLYQEWLSGILSEDDDVYYEVLEDAPKKFGLRCNVDELDSARAKEFQEKLGIETLKNMLDQFVFCKKREQILQMFRDDYDRTISIIRATAKESLLEEVQNMIELQHESDNYNAQCDQIQQSIDEIEMNRKDIQELLSQFREGGV